MDRELLMFLSLVNSMSGYDNYSLDDMFEHALNYNEEMDNVSFKMNMLMLRLLNDGFTEDEVYEMINSLLPEGMENLTEEQKIIIRNDAKKLIKKRKENLNYE